ncbi:MAG: hypothetical protein ABH875_04580 [Candidatus Omnitrophota bacterium]
MKNLLAAVTAFAIALVFIPQVFAQDPSARLEVSVTFDLQGQDDFVIVTEGALEGRALEEMKFDVIAKDSIGHEVLFTQLVVYVDGEFRDAPHTEPNVCRGTFVWTPGIEDISDEVTVLQIYAVSVAEDGSKIEKDKTIAVKVLDPDPNTMELIKMLHKLGLISQEVGGIYEDGLKGFYLKDFGIIEGARIELEQVKEAALEIKEAAMVIGKPEDLVEKVVAAADTLIAEAGEKQILLDNAKELCELMIQLDGVQDQAGEIFAEGMAAAQAGDIAGVVQAMKGLGAFHFTILIIKENAAEFKKPVECVEAVLNAADALLEEIKGLQRQLDEAVKIIIKTDDREPPIDEFEVKEGDELKFRVIAEDPIRNKIGFTQTTLPGGDFVLDPMDVIGSTSGTFIWTPEADTAGEYEASFTVAVIEDEGQTRKEVTLYVKITVLSDEPRISIELTPASWVIENVRLGEKVHNLNNKGIPIHALYNTGDVSVLVDIGYGPHIEEGIVPGTAQGLNTFTTEVERGQLGMSIIPPNDRIKLVNLNAGDEAFLHFVYGAPIAIEGDIGNHRTAYELRAYSTIPSINKEQ